MPKRGGEENKKKRGEVGERKSVLGMNALECMHYSGQNCFTE